MKEVRIVQMFVRFAVRRGGSGGLVAAMLLSSRPAHAESMVSLAGRARELVDRAVDRGFALTVQIIDRVSEGANWLGGYLTQALDQLGMDKQQAALIGGSILIALLGFWLLPRGPDGTRREAFAAQDEMMLDARHLASSGKRKKRRQWRLRDAVDAMKADAAREARGKPVSVD